MKEEMEAHFKNHTWGIVVLPKGKKAINNGWVYKLKRDLNNNVER